MRPKTSGGIRLIGVGQFPEDRAGRGLESALLEIVDLSTTRISCRSRVRFIDWPDLSLVESSTLDARNSVSAIQRDVSYCFRRTSHRSPVSVVFPSERAGMVREPSLVVTGKGEHRCTEYGPMIARLRGPNVTCYSEKPTHSTSVGISRPNAGDMARTEPTRVQGKYLSLGLELRVKPSCMSWATANRRATSPHREPHPAVCFDGRLVESQSSTHGVGRRPPSSLSMPPESCPSFYPNHQLLAECLIHSQIWVQDA